MTTRPGKEDTQRSYNTNSEQKDNPLKIIAFILLNFSHVFSLAKKHVFYDSAQ